MSSFRCEKCGAPIIDSSAGYITGCMHYPLKVQKQKQTLEDIEKKKRYARQQKKRAKTLALIKTNKNAKRAAIRRRKNRLDKN